MSNTFAFYSAFNLICLNLTTYLWLSLSSMFQNYLKLWLYLILFLCVSYSQCVSQHRDNVSLPPYKIAHSYPQQGSSKLGFVWLNMQEADLSLSKSTHAPHVFTQENSGLHVWCLALVVLLQSNCLQKQYLLPKQIGSLQQLNNLQSYT